MAPRHEEPRSEKTTRTRPPHNAEYLHDEDATHIEEPTSIGYQNKTRTVERKTPEQIATDRRRAALATWLVLLLFFALMALLATLFYGVITQ